MAIKSAAMQPTNKPMRDATGYVPDQARPWSNVSAAEARKDVISGKTVVRSMTRSCADCGLRNGSEGVRTRV